MTASCVPFIFLVSLKSYDFVKLAWCYIHYFFYYKVLNDLPMAISWRKNNFFSWQHLESADSLCCFLSHSFMEEIQTIYHTTTTVLYITRQYRIQQLNQRNSTIKLDDCRLSFILPQHIHQVITNSLLSSTTT